MGSKGFNQLIIGQLASLWKTIHTFSDLHIDTVVVYLGSQVVLLNDGLRYHVHGNAHVLKILH